MQPKRVLLTTLRDCRGGGGGGGGGVTSEDVDANADIIGEYGVVE